MTRIPACTDAISSLVLDHFTNGFTTPSAQAAHEKALPKTFLMTKERLKNRKNIILSHMGQVEENR